MRIGTWNLAGRWSPAHERLLESQDCDVWLLTEVSLQVELAGYGQHRTSGLMARGRAWAAVLSRDPVEPLPDPHPASSAASIGDIVYCSSILPWRSCGARAPWTGARHADKTAATIAALDTALPRTKLVWGGDFNHALGGAEVAGSMAGRGHVERFIEARELQVPTAQLPHRLDGLLSIDHIAVAAARTTTAFHVPAGGLSDHPAYVADVRD